MHSNRPAGIPLVAALMILFGVAEIDTGLTHSFLGLISTTSGPMATYAAAAIGALYAIAGALLLPMKKRWARLALLCLALVVAGRVFLVAAGLYPTDTFLQTFSIVVGTAIAIAFAAYIGLTWRSLT